MVCALIGSGKIKKTIGVGIVTTEYSRNEDGNFLLSLIYYR